MSLHEPHPQTSPYTPGYEALLDQDALSLVDTALSTTPPWDDLDNDAALTTYLVLVSRALHALLPWKDTVVDQLETVTLLTVVHNLQDCMKLRIDEDDTSMMDAIGLLRQSCDHNVAYLARVIFTRQCALKIKHTDAERADVRAWLDTAWPVDVNPSRKRVFALVE